MTEPTEAEIEAAARAMMASVDRDGRVIKWEREDPIIRSAFTKQARAALTAAAQVRERAGNAEPTQEQWKAGATALYGHSEEQATEWGKHEKWESCGHQAAEVFKAMVRAAPALMPIYGATEVEKQK